MRLDKDIVSAVKTCQLNETAADDESHPGIEVAFIANICPEEFGDRPLFVQARS